MNSSSDSASGTGVVRNSALSFLAPNASSQPIATQTQPLAAAGRMNETRQNAPERIPQPTEMSVIPAGVVVLCAACSRIYPDQPNPLQVTTRLKYWLGGEDPLDYISMYWNPGDPAVRAPPHYHYITFGLSDLHGDGRVHPQAGYHDSPSGFGFELSMRVAAVRDRPPLWPAALLQALARYVFITGNKLCAGDHVSWHTPLDAASSRLRHLLLCTETVFASPLLTPHGTVRVLRVVPCTSRELSEARLTSVDELLDKMRLHPSCGGEWSVCEVSRRGSCVRRRCSASTVQGDTAAHLAGVSAFVRWEQDDVEDTNEQHVPVHAELSRSRRLGECAEPRGHCAMSTDSGNIELHARAGSVNSFHMASIESALYEAVVPPIAPQYPGSVHIIMNPEAAALIPLAVRARVLHGRHFTWQCAGTTVNGGGTTVNGGGTTDNGGGTTDMLGGAGVTLVGEGVSDAFACPLKPFAAKGKWLQVYVNNDLANKILSLPWSGVDSDTESDDEEDPSDPAGNKIPTGVALSPPYTRNYPEYRLKITVLPDHCFC